VTFKDLKKRVTLETAIQQQSRLSEICKNKPFLDLGYPSTLTTSMWFAFRTSSKRRRLDRHCNSKKHYDHLYASIPSLQPSSD